MLYVNYISIKKSAWEILVVMKLFYTLTIVVDNMNAHMIKNS